MTAVFADTSYWIAIVRPNDQLAKPAKSARSLLGNVCLLTTDEVLTEFLAALSYDKCLRRQAVEMVRAILGDPNIKVLPQTRESFVQGISLYEQRFDKKYSLTDCISMNAMRSESVTQVLTNDHHFEQEGFDVLMSKV